MEFRDLKRQYVELKEDIDKAISEVVLNADFISGMQVQELEHSLAKYVGTKHCITCANGTDALQLALMAWNVGEGDAVFVPNFTFFASGEAPAMCGATPVFVDVERNTFNISPEELEKAIQYVLAQGNLNPRVIVAVDLFGQPANFLEIRKMAEKYDLLLLEDGAQGFGGKIGGQKACSFGDIGTTSFFPAKPLGCYGDGGAVFTNNDEWAEKIRSLCVHGKGKDKYDNIRIGMNSRLDTIQAAVLQVKLKAFINYELDAVNQVAEWYFEELKGVITVPYVVEGYFSSWAQYTVVCKDEIERARIQEAMHKADIPTMIYYAKGMHEQKAFEYKAGIDDSNYANTNYLKDRVLSLPMHPYLTKKDIKKISQALLS